MTAAGLIIGSPAILVGASAPADRTAGTPAFSLGNLPAPTDDGPLRTRAVFSGPEENDDTEPDSVFTKPAARFARGSTTSPSGSTGSAATGEGNRGGGTSLHSLPNANECLNATLDKLRGLEVNVALLGSHKYMVADCLGVKVSAGQFKLRFDNPKLSFVGGKVVFECGIDHVSFSAFKLRFKPNVTNPLKFCNFSKKHTAGGSADDIRLKVEFDPIVANDHCHISGLGAVDVTVRIGSLNLSGVQNDLDKAAKNMVEDALSVFLDYELAIDLGTLIDHFLQAGCGILPQGDVFGGPGNRGGSGGGSSASDPDVLSRIAELESRVTALEQGSGSAANSATTAPARTNPVETVGRAESGTAAPVSGASPPSTEAIGRANPPTVEPASRADPRTAEPVGAFQTVPNPALKGRLGRIVIAFPAGTKASGTRADIYKSGVAKELRTEYGDFGVEMPPGTYDLNIGGHLVKGIIVRSRSDTRVHVGVLRLNAGKDTRFDLYEPGSQKAFGTYYGQNDVGLPPGKYDIEVSSQRETVTITAAAITEY